MQDKGTGLWPVWNGAVPLSTGQIPQSIYHRSDCQSHSGRRRRESVPALPLSHLQSPMTSYWRGQAERFKYQESKEWVCMLHSLDAQSTTTILYEDESESNKQWSGCQDCWVPSALTCRAAATIMEKLRSSLKTLPRSPVTTCKLHKSWACFGKAWSIACYAWRNSWS